MCLPPWSARGQAGWPDTHGWCGIGSDPSPDPFVRPKRSLSQHAEQWNAPDESLKNPKIPIRHLKGDIWCGPCRAGQGNGLFPPLQELGWT